MRCFATPTTAIAAELRRRDVDVLPAARDVMRSDAQLRAQDVMEAVLFREILKPLANGLGPVGEIAIGVVADSLFVRRVR